MVVFAASLTASSAFAQGTDAKSAAAREEISLEA